MFRLGKKVVVPRVTKENRLLLSTIASMKHLVTGPFGIMEPAENCPAVLPTDIDVFVVPGLAFDRQGHRLGWGQGYYDRLLQTVQVPLIGLAYSCQIVGLLPFTKYDIVMTTVISETEVIETA
jgi:5-formyltetrahydrofolate cyclo-ligase